ncbi:MAG: hypothetical protein IJQ06_00945 [Paludibacteraceae bacterium]|nr:hypothetical protein [Paludibacteraceae bacterium]
MTEQIADMDNLRLAFFKAQRGKRAKKEVEAYRKELDTNLLQLRAELIEGKVNVGNYHLFKIYDPKERTVCAAAFRERVLHHALMNVCAPIFERHFIETTYANRTNKGTYKALDTAFKAVNKYAYVAKLDVRKYFDHIDHTILTALLGRLFKDQRLLHVLQQIIQSYHVELGKGVPIGNLTSQYFANYYLSPIDHYAKEELSIPIYVRYMDDILMFHNDYERLKEKVVAYQQAAETRLLLTLKPPVIQKTEIPVSFLGYRLSKHKIGLTQRSKKRFKQKYKAALRVHAHNSQSEQETQAHLLPLFAFVQHGYTKRYRKQILNKVTSRRVQTA